MWRTLLIVVTIATTACAGTDATEPPKCADFDSDACVPAYPAEFDRIMVETLQPMCKVQGGACHGHLAAEGASRGLVIDDDFDATYATLLGSDGGPTFVTPGDAVCSPVTTRINLPADSEFLMPPGAVALDEGVRCAIAQWIAHGAAR